MIRQILLVVLGVSILGVGMAWAVGGPDTLWTRVFGGIDDEFSYYVEQTRDGGYIIVGSTRTFGAGGSDLWLIKTDANGYRRWHRTFGGTGDDYGTCVQEVEDGYVTVGTYASDGPSRVWLMKVDMVGNLVWQRFYLLGNQSYGYSVRELQLNEEGYIIGGCSYLGGGVTRALFIKTDAQGETLWTRQFVGQELVDFNSVEEASDGGYVAAGRALGFRMGSHIDILAKFSPDGDLLWVQYYTGGFDIDSGFRSVRRTSDGGYILAGAYVIMPIPPEPDPYPVCAKVVKTNSAGWPVWSRSFTLAPSSTQAGCAQECQGGGYVILCSPCWVIRTKPNGDTLWTRHYGPGRGSWIEPTRDGGYIICGSVNHGGGLIIRDVWLAKTDIDTGISGVPKSTVTSPYIRKSSPNPFVDGTTVEYFLPVESFVEIEVYNVMGQRVKTLLRGTKPAGLHTVMWDGKSSDGDQAPGIYLCQLRADGYTATHKMVLLK